MAMGCVCMAFWIVVASATKSDLVAGRSPVSAPMPCLMKWSIDWARERSCATAYASMTASSLLGILTDVRVVLLRGQER